MTHTNQTDSIRLTGLCQVLHQDKADYVLRETREIPTMQLEHLLMKSVLVLSLINHYPIVF